MMNTDQIKTINEVAEICYQNAVDHGFHDFGENRGQFLTRAVANLHGEVSELWEAYRRNQLDELCDKAEKMETKLSCAEEELSDLAIRVFDTARRMNINIGLTIAAKHKYNVSRPYRHGGKAA